MTSVFEKQKKLLKENNYTWLVTGVAGFIGSHLLSFLLKNGQTVVGLDNFITGKKENLDEVRGEVAQDEWKSFTFVEGDITNLDTLNGIFNQFDQIDYVLHQAALGSVPRSIENPLLTNEINVSGFLSILSESMQFKVKRFVYASSSSVYGDSEELPKVESRTGTPLSPYAVSKYTNELYSQVFSSIHGISTVGLRYFNVFGPRQDPDGPYAAVIPRWMSSIKDKTPCYVFGNGDNTSRDFTYVENVVQANILSALIEPKNESEKSFDIYNVAVGGRVTLRELYDELREIFLGLDIKEVAEKPITEASRPGDIAHSSASIDLIKQKLGYEPTHSVKVGLEETARWFLSA